MTALLDSYAKVAGAHVISHLQQLSESLQGMRVVHVNSTKEGGGVAEILHKLVPLMNELGIDTRWEVIEGEGDFYQCTKSFHNSLQGNAVHIHPKLLHAFESTNRRNAERLGALLTEADIVFIHDPQPAPLLSMCPARRGKWVWRCHIDVSRPYRPVWKYLSRFVNGYDASIFSMADFARPLPHPGYLIPPSIDPLSDKNVELPREEVEKVHASFGIDAGRPMILQVSRFDRFKDPIGVVEAYRGWPRSSFRRCSWCWPAAAPATTRKARRCIARCRRRRTAMPMSTCCCCRLMRTAPSTPCSGPPISCCRSRSGRGSG